MFEGPTIIARTPVSARVVALGVANGGLGISHRALGGGTWPLEIS